MEKSKINMLMSIVIVAILCLIGYNFIKSNSYQPEDLSELKPIDSFTFNQCEKFPDQTMNFIKNPTSLHTIPGSIGVSVRVPSCHNIEFYIYKETNFEGEKWILVRSYDGNFQGWQIESIMR